MASKASIEVAAVVFAESKRSGTFTAKEFNGFLTMAGEHLEEERVDEILTDLVGMNSLRAIGPGVYAALPEARKP